MNACAVNFESEDNDEEDSEGDEDDDNDVFIDCLPLLLVLFLASGIFPPLPTGPLPLSRSFAFTILGLVLVFGPLPGGVLRVLF